jgi:hypothetical protein
VLFIQNGTDKKHFKNKRGWPLFLLSEKYKITTHTSSKTTQRKTTTIIITTTTTITNTVLKVTHLLP